MEVLALFSLLSVKICFLKEVNHINKSLSNSFTLINLAMANTNSSFAKDITHKTF